MMQRFHVWPVVFFLAAAGLVGCASEDVDPTAADDPSPTSSADSVDESVDTSATDSPATPDSVTELEPEDLVIRSNELWGSFNRMGKDTLCRTDFDDASEVASTATFFIELSRAANDQMPDAQPWIAGLTDEQATQVLYAAAMKYCTNLPDV
ncbi:MAG: hypothetical protein GY911_04740 [Actinomycetales bacterium]|nr:hypothetical protein [Actinomycetales bacterium]